MYQNEPGGPMKRPGLVNKMKQVAANLKTKIEDKKKKKEFEKKAETFKNTSKKVSKGLKTPPTMGGETSTSNKLKGAPKGLKTPPATVKEFKSNSTTLNDRINKIKGY